MLVTLTISVVMAAMIAYLTSLGVLVFSLDSAVETTFLPRNMLPNTMKSDELEPQAQTAEDMEEFFFLRTNLQILIHDSNTNTKRFQFLSILETNTLRNMLSSVVGSWVLPTMWTIIRM